MYYFIVNPVAGSGRSLRVMNAISQSLRDRSIPYTIRHTQRPGHATELAGDAVRSGYKNIISLGGDGTIFEVVNGLIGKECVLGIIPGGTGNDFIHALNIPKNPMEALELILKGDTKKIDLGMINGRYFINVAGTGFDADVLLTTRKVKKLLKGKLAYLLSVFITLIRYPFYQVHIEVDGRSFERKILLVAIGNGQYYGGGMMVTPKATVDDGLLDVCIISSLPKWKIPFLMPKFFSGTHLSQPYVEYFKSGQIRIKSAHPLAINIDGELIGTTPVECSISGTNLLVFAP